MNFAAKASKKAVMKVRCLRSVSFIGSKGVFVRSFIVIDDDQIRSSLKSSFPVSLLGNIMEPAESVKNLGVILDAENSMQRHVANLCHISYYHLR